MEFMLISDYANISVFQHISIEICQYINYPNQCINTSIYRCINMSTCQDVSMSICHYFRMSTHQYIYIYIPYRNINISTCQHVNISICQDGTVSIPICMYYYNMSITICQHIHVWTWVRVHQCALFWLVSYTFLHWRLCRLWHTDALLFCIKHSGGDQVGPP